MGMNDRLVAALADRYRIERELGAGGMATVYLAEDLKHDRRVALKVLKPELAAVLGADRFVVEIKTTAALQHPHILPLFDSGAADSFLYYVMPYIEGETLRGKLNRESQLGVEEALQITRDVADALDYAHRHGVIHRDIKPENILLHDGRPVVADFGIALAISAAGGGRMTETGLSLGTPHYMSPEQATADRDLTPRSDVYSLACVLYEMLAGNPPHTGPSAQAILVRILTDQPRPVSETRASVPPHVGAALVKALEKLPADRFESAKAFRDALADPHFSYTARTPGRGILAASAPAVRQPSRWRAGLTAAALLGLAGLAAWGWLRPRPEPAVMRHDLSLGGIEPVGIADVVISPDGSMLAVAGTRDGERAIWLRRLGEPDFQKVLGTDTGILPSFSPDNQWLVFRKIDEDALVRVAVTGGGAMTLVGSGAGRGAGAGQVRPFDPHWGTDDWIVFASPAGIYRVPATGGPPELLEQAGGRQPFLLPDGSGILHSADGNVSVLDFATDSSTVLVSQAFHPWYVETGHLLYVAEDGGLFAVPFDLETHRVTGSQVRVLDRVGAGVVRRGYSVSRDGTLIHFEAAAALGGGVAPPNHLVIMDFTGGADTVPLPPGARFNPRFSPDGRRLVYDIVSRGTQSDIYAFDLVTGTNTQLTFDGDNDDPVWSPDGTRILWDRDNEGAGEDLYVKPADNSGSERLVFTMPGDQNPSDWLPGDTVLMTSYSAGGADLLVASLADSANARAYLEAPWNERDLALSPDHTLGAFVSSETGSAEVWIRNWPLPEGKWRVSTGTTVAGPPRWSPDGRSVYYWRVGVGAPDTLYRARVDRTPAVVVRAPEPLLSRRTSSVFAWDLHPDGSRFVVSVPGEQTAAPAAAGTQSQTSRYLVVLNWFSELRALTSRVRR